jgi:hypothetical protein
VNTDQDGHEAIEHPPKGFIVKARVVRLLIAAGLVLAALTTLFHAREGSAFGRSTYFHPHSYPLKMRITGVLHPYEAKDTVNGMYTFPVSVHGEERIFQTEKAQTLTGSLHGSSVLSRLFPQRLRFVASRDLVDTLKSAEIQGRMLVLTGYMYASSNRFWVTQLEEPGETSEEKEG